MLPLLQKAVLLTASLPTEAADPIFLILVHVVLSLLTFSYHIIKIGELYGCSVKKSTPWFCYATLSIQKGAWPMPWSWWHQRFWEVVPKKEFGTKQACKPQKYRSSSQLGRPLLVTRGVYYLQPIQRKKRREKVEKKFHCSCTLISSWSSPIP